ncbi:hypothetical protein HCJ66_08085 [Listeria sp. FSL L7-1582]|nr:hypothetical protein [Listeria portnoyi]
MHDVLSRMYQVKTGVNEILAGKAFNGTTHTYDSSKMQLGWLNHLVPEKKPKKTYDFDDYTKTLEGSFWVLSKNGITNRETAEASIAYNDGLKDGTIKIGNGDPDIDFDTANMLAAMDGYNLLTGEEITKAQSFSIISAVLLGGIAMKGRGIKIPKSNLAKIQKELEIRDFSNTSKNAKEIISERVNGLDLREHPTQIKQLSSKKMQELRQKVDNRTITKQEYVEYNWNKKFAKKRKAGVTEFWDMEADRITNGEFTTRNWSDNQMEDILMGKVPKFDGKSIAGHHSFSASKYPHLADKGEIIYPATFNEHLYGWHGGNWKNSLPGEPIIIIKDF